MVPVADGENGAKGKKKKSKKQAGKLNAVPPEFQLAEEEWKADDPPVVIELEEAGNSSCEQVKLAF